MVCFGRELSDTWKGVEVLEEVGAEHSTAHKAATVRMDVLQKELRQLRRQRSAKGEPRQTREIHDASQGEQPDRSRAPSTRRY